MVGEKWKVPCKFVSSSPTPPDHDLEIPLVYLIWKDDTEQASTGDQPGVTMGRKYY